MAKLFFIRHQAAGVLFQFPFAQAPTQAQRVAVERFCVQQNGVSHSKTPGVPYWTRVVELDVLGPNDIPDVPEHTLSIVSSGGGNADKFIVDGQGHVGSRDT